MAWLGLLLGWSVAGGDRAAISARGEYFGLCDASAAVAVDDTRFLVASDEDSRLRLYSSRQPGPPLQTFELTGFLEVDKHKPETDVEAAAKIGDLAYWITSHGLNAEGRRRESRGRLFATRIVVTGRGVTVQPEGQPYKRLLSDLVAEPRLAAYGLRQAVAIAPKAPGGLNIEGLAATPEGQLLIGFRNPVPGGKALLVPLVNPTEVIAGHTARFGAPLELDLGGLSIRDLGFADGTYMVVAGPYDGEGRFRLFSWRGAGTPAVRLKLPGLKGLHPEAILLYPKLGLSEFQLLSDDGNLEIDGCRCKDLKDVAHKRFRSLWVRNSPER